MGSAAARSFTVLESTALKGAFPPPGETTRAALVRQSARIPFCREKTRLNRHVVPIPRSAHTAPRHLRFLTISVVFHLGLRGSPDSLWCLYGIRWA